MMTMTIDTSLEWGSAKSIRVEYWREGKTEKGELSKLAYEGMLLNLSLPIQLAQSTRTHDEHLGVHIINDIYPEKKTSNQHDVGERGG